MIGMKKTGPGATLALVAVLVAGPAAAVTGLVTYADATHTNSDSPKTAAAECMSGELVVGGGAYIAEPDDAEAGQVVLTRLQPIHPKPRVIGAASARIALDPVDIFVGEAEAPAAMTRPGS